MLGTESLGNLNLFYFSKLNSTLNLLLCGYVINTSNHKVKVSKLLKTVMKSSSYYMITKFNFFDFLFTPEMIITYSQMHRTDKQSQHSSFIWPVWLNG